MIVHIPMLLYSLKWIYNWFQFIHHFTPQQKNSVADAAITSIVQWLYCLIIYACIFIILYFLHEDIKVYYENTCWFIFQCINYHKCIIHFVMITLIQDGAIRWFLGLSANIVAIRWKACNVWNRNGEKTLYHSIDHHFYSNIYNGC